MDKAVRRFCRWCPFYRFFRKAALPLVSAGAIRLRDQTKNPRKTRRI
ncbi:MAG: hypothetical protein ACOX88_09565 [Christensenellales bacterium]|jgi:hypothetical protein